MRKLIFTSAIATILTFGCSSQTEVKEVNQTKKDPVVGAEKAKPRQITKQIFLDEIMDFEKNPDKWIYKSTMPGVIDFYADWCRPCRMTSPILEELAVEYAGKINFYKVNVDSEQELAGIFGVQSIPAFLYMPKSGAPMMTAGIASSVEETKAMFRKQLDQLLIENK
jgi:thioredoxin 1